MPEVIPWPGLRYRPEVVGNLVDVLAPPYDIISPAEQDVYYRWHPYNIIRLELGRTDPTDTPDHNQYTRAAGYLQAWLQEKVLVPDDRPCFYSYELNFPFRGSLYRRHGFFARVALEEYSPAGILPHEDTLPGARADRLALLRACRANFSPIFGLYDDPDHQAESLFAGACSQISPAVDVTDTAGQRHRLWAISDSWVLEQVTALMRRQTILIADGHHRYETALQHYRDTGDPQAQYVMMVLTNLHDPGLLILPTHRLVHGILLPPASQLLQQLGHHLAIREYPLVAENLNFFLDHMAATGQDTHAFGLYLGGNRIYLLSRSRKQTDAAEVGMAEQLDVAVAHRLVIEGILHANPLEHLAFTHQAEEAIAAVQEGRSQLALLLNPPHLEQVVAIARAGQKMPQKSTYFWPKLVTGLVINLFDIV